VKKEVEIIETSWTLAIKIHAHEQLYFSTEVYWNLELNLSGIDLQNSTSSSNFGPINIFNTKMHTPDLGKSKYMSRA